MASISNWRRLPNGGSTKRWICGLVLMTSLFVGFALLAPTGLRADVPVIDFAAIAQMIRQYSQMAQQLAALYQQVTLLRQQVQSITGHYGAGSLGKAVDNWQGSTWATISDMVHNGINPGDAAQVQAYKEARNRYMGTNPMLSAGLQTTNPRMSAVYSRAYQDAVTGMGLGESEFDRVAETATELEQLRGKIDQTENLKSAMDLNTAVNVRIAQLNAEQLRMHAAQLRIDAASKNDATSGYAAEVEFFAE